MINTIQKYITTYSDSLGKDVEEIVNDDGDLYEIIGVKEEILTDEDSLLNLEYVLNVDCREGCAIHPVKNSCGEFVYIDHPNKIVLCVLVELWG